MAFRFLDLSEDHTPLMNYAMRKDMHDVIRVYNRGGRYHMALYSETVRKAMYKEYKAIIGWDTKWRFGIKFKRPIDMTKFLEEYSDSN